MEKLFQRVIQKCDEAELYKKEEYKTQLTIRNGKVQLVKGNKTLGISLRINKDGKFGSAVATDLEDDSIIERAILSSKYQKEETLKFKAVESRDVQCYDQRVAELTVEELKQEGIRILEMFKAVDPSIVLDIFIIRSVQNVHIRNTSGLDSQYNPI